MKNLVLKLFMLCIGFTSWHASSQCPGTETSLGFPSTELVYDISVTHPKCGVEGAIEVTVPAIIPPTITFLWSINGGDYTIVPATGLDIIPADPGTYSFAVIDVVNSQLDLCNFEVIDSTTCQGDYTADGIVNSADLLLFLGDFTEDADPCVGCCGDFDGNGIVDVTDLMTFLSVFGTTCPLAPVTEVVQDENQNNENIQKLFDNPWLINPTSIQIYPNPAVGQINIAIENLPQDMDKTELQIIDITGRIINNVEWTTEQNLVRTNLNNLDPGTYFITFSTNGQTYSESFIIQ